MSGGGGVSVTDDESIRARDVDAIPGRVEALRETVERMNLVLQSMAAGVVMVDAEGRIEYANPAAAALSGLKPEDLIGQLVADPAWQLTDETGTVLPYEALPVPTALRERRAVQGVELGVPTLAGVMRWLRVSAQPIFDRSGELRGAVVTTEDVTERHALAERLLQAQKIEAMGQLAGGIAHDFNNLLTIILSNAELILDRGSPSTPSGTGAAEIRDAATRGAALTRQLLTFARKQVVQPRPVHLDRLSASVERMLRRTLGEGIDLTRSSAPDLWLVKVDPSQFEQVLVNMAINARDAMKRSGSLSIETRNVTVDAQQAKAHPGAEPGDFVLLSVTDTGTGMPAELTARIFDPFFTTKPVGQGTGVGLSICHGVVEQAHGFITVETKLGHGTTFNVWLPRCVDDPAPVAAIVEKTIPSGTGTILLVEDQAPVLRLVANILMRYGYDVVSACSGKRALASYEEMARPPDLLLTDVAMPGMSGIELAEILYEKAPGLPVLFMTGHIDVGSDLPKGPTVEENLLLKPFTPMQLVERVQQA
ncbi:MAG: response regulator, partial [Deltaproteobacteria bacterium]|nr:response regulator [Deltaproteobacteria bacterium]